VAGAHTWPARVCGAGIPSGWRVPYDHTMRYARDERLALCTLLDETGPNEPTLCEGWTTLDLAGHLVLRERRPDAGVGILGGPLAAYTQGVQRKLQERLGYPKLVRMIRSGPPRFSLFGLPGVDERANLTEFFVHHEDVRRARPDWEPRKLDQGLSETLWQRLSMAKFMLRKAPVGVELVRDGEPGFEPSDGAKIRITAKARTPVVTVTGTPAELTMWAFGRKDAAQVRFDGSEADVAALTGARWGI
jgi:uncharacterized protein (TIGR03085 family)